MNLTHAERLPTLDRVPVADGEELDVAADFDDFAGDFVTKNQSLPSGGAAADHVSIAATDVSDGHLEDDAALALGSDAGGMDSRPIHQFQFRVGDVVDADLSGPDVGHRSIRCHRLPRLGKHPA